MTNTTKNNKYIFGALVLLVVITALNAWVLMLLCGGIATALGKQTISYETSVLVTLLLYFVSGIVRGVNIK